jgi:hypothetical protein
MRALLVAALVVAGCDGGGILSSVAGDGCGDVGAALCDRAAACGIVAPARVDVCVDEYRDACEAELELAGDQVDACVAALPGFDCDELAAGASPPECE